MMNEEPDWGDDLTVRTHVHREPHDTEVQAAESALKKASASMETCLAIFKLYPDGLTHDELQRNTGIHSARRRAADLKNRGLIYDSGVRRNNARGKTCIVWRAKMSE